MINNTVRFEFEKMHGDIVFRDAITLPSDHTLTESDIEAMKQERFDNWVAIITAPPPEPTDVVSDAPTE
jgi:hypothetical protein